MTDQALDQVDTLIISLADLGYIADRQLGLTLNLMQRLGRPLLIEGEAGVGKTQIAKVLAEHHDCPLIRLQCYEGLDSRQSLYEWHYAKQLLALNSDASDIFSEAYLLERPLLKSIRQPGLSVLLIDEVDRADSAFEAFLLELLAEFQITIPELGTLRAVHRPLVVLTANATRELSDALRRRCLYHYMGYPSTDREAEIIRCHYPELDAHLAQQVTKLLSALRDSGPSKTPGIAETLDWVMALHQLGINDLPSHAELAAECASTLLKTEEDVSELGGQTMVNLINRVCA